MRENRRDQSALQVARLYILALRNNERVETARANVELSKAVLSFAERQEAARGDAGRKCWTSLSGAGSCGRMVPSSRLGRCSGEYPPLVVPPRLKRMGQLRAAHVQEPNASDSTRPSSASFPRSCRRRSLFFPRITSFNPDQVSSMAHSFTSTSPNSNASSRTTSSVISDDTANDFFGHDIQIIASWMRVRAISLGSEPMGPSPGPRPGSSPTSGTRS